MEQAANYNEAVSDSFERCGRMERNSKQASLTIPQMRAWLRDYCAVETSIMNDWQVRKLYNIYKIRMEGTYNVLYE